MLCEAYSLFYSGEAWLSTALSLECLDLFFCNEYMSDSPSYDHTSREHSGISISSIKSERHDISVWTYCSICGAVHAQSDLKTAPKEAHAFLCQSERIFLRRSGTVFVRPKP